MAKRKDSRKAAKNRKAAKEKERLPINGDTLRRAVAWIVDAGIFSQLKFHGNTSWKAVDLVVLAVVWVWSGNATLTGAFTEAHGWSTEVLGRAAVGTYQGLLKALAVSTKVLLPILKKRLHELMRTQARKHWRIGLWVALAVDGSRVSVPRSKENEKAFCAPNYGKSSTAKYRRKKNKKNRNKTRMGKKKEPVKPQIWVTLLWHMGMQMPWSWMTGPSNSSERDHLRQLLKTEEFPKNSLFCCDAGFTGYDLWKEILDDGHSFLVRVGANVRLLRKLGYVEENGDTVYFWPESAARENQPPLVLRLLRLRVGRCEMSLVTNVLDPKRLSVDEAMRMYRLRWGVELQFRTIKQTFGRRKLRSRTPDRALVELDWSLLGLWMIQLFAVKEQLEIGEVPEHCSAALAIQVVRETFQHWNVRPVESFRSKLRRALKDKYERRKSKKARYQPNYKDKPSAKHPVVRAATRKHKRMLRQHLDSLGVAA